MKHTIEFEMLMDELVEELYQTRYIIGRVDEKHYIYIWTMYLSEEEIEVTAEMLNEPVAEDGAMIGTAQEITDHIEECVGLHRDDSDEEIAQAAIDIVAEMKEQLKGN